MRAQPRRGRIKRDDKLGIGYGRYSTVQQGSLPEQHATNAEVAAEYGVTLLEQFGDEGISRSIAERPALLEVFAYIEANPQVGWIVVPELERMTDGVGQRDEIARMCQRLDVTIITEDMGDIDPFDEQKMLDADERAVKSHQEIIKIRRRTRRSMKQKVIHGRVAMRPAYGTRMKPLIGPDGEELPPGVQLVDEHGKRIRSGVLETHPDELPWLLKIFKWADEGISYERICGLLKEADVPTKTGRGEWRANTIAGILANPLYKGEMVWGRQATVRPREGGAYLVERADTDPARVTMESPLGAIIDPEMWERIQQARLDKRGNRTGSRRVHEPQLFDDFVYCAMCGHKMYGRVDNLRKVENKGWNATWRYGCNGSRPGVQVREGFPGGRCQQAFHSITDKKLLAALATLGQRDSQVSVSLKQGKVSAPELEAARVKKELGDLKARRERVGKAFISGLISEAQMVAQRDEIDTETKALQATLGQDHRPVTPGPTPAIGDGWGRMVALLGDTTIPAKARAQALRAAGVNKLFLNGVDVVVEFIGPDAGLQSGLLRLQDCSSMVDAD